MPSVIAKVMKCANPQCDFSQPNYEGPCPKCGGEVNIETVLIVCEHCPIQQKGQQEEQLMQQVETTLCIPRCGYYKDAATNHIKLACFHPKSPYLPHIKKQLGIG